MITSHKRLYYIILLLIIILSSCTRFESVRDPYTLYIHISAEPGHLNPITSNEAIASSINTYIYETLLDMGLMITIRVKTTISLQNGKISSDKLHYRFYLKKKHLHGVMENLFTADDNYIFI